ncbi:hypothetical protein L208DRAFT_1496221 [Tricholoma matsutake]|nr:hypothetical protein L208DRAFT_1496221 [Tricholoma matsutake 945]
MFLQCSFLLKFLVNSLSPSESPTHSSLSKASSTLPSVCTGFPDARLTFYCYSITVVAQSIRCYKVQANVLLVGLGWTMFVITLLPSVCAFVVADFYCWV